MNIQRKYSLPNCTLLLEGLSDSSKASHVQELRPVLSILVNAECQISGHQPLLGGREFFESLARVASSYAQECLSNVPNPQAHNIEVELVQIEKIDTNKHKMVVNSELPQPTLDYDKSNIKPPIEVNLNTVQLFDLVEAIDQFFADTQTLPEFTLQLEPVGKRYNNSKKTVVQQAVPATLGVSGLVAAAAIFALIPAPKIQTPKPETEKEVSSAVKSSQTGEEKNLDSNVSESNSSSTKSAKNLSSQVQDLEALLSQVPEITDSSVLKILTRRVHNQLNNAWNNRSQITENLIYRVGVGTDAAILGYKSINQGANTHLERTPLPELLYNPNKRNPAGSEPIAQFRIVFTPEGILQVSPWHGYGREIIGTQIKDPVKVDSLKKNLETNIREKLSEKQKFEEVLKYRVAVNGEGSITDYEPLNEAALENFRDTPLPHLYKSTKIAQTSNLDPAAVAQFQVEFQPDTDLSVSHWQVSR
ncbi:DUF4335 domain-containing protein [Mastigocoleus testarum]|uniref:DUF4335 domain-containing protein n=1 Tax=Mastigocoleus testarum BC008 TaxID=371196 RepID=A0A0V7ZTB0_9CYAN|nr:DUF4335 domain-containing protein [Mastigocoleus testarum]KST67602.1 hypothetical protein BC008_30875 [Mastigocoleus testarum BC008]KST69762.1 hypothetical protein BC008_35975 [Mastigocoleus testarum BC008]